MNNNERALTAKLTINKNVFYKFFYIIKITIMIKFTEIKF